LSRQNRFDIAHIQQIRRCHSPLSVIKATLVTFNQAAFSTTIEHVHYERFVFLNS